MKKMLMLVMLLLIVSSVFAESVILNDGRTLKGEIVGKKGDSIYLRSDGNIYLLTRSLVKQIKNDGNLTITKLTYKKKDFMDDGVDVTQLTPIGELEETVTYSKPGAKNGKSFFMPASLPEQNINEMTEREFQLYLTQLQVNEINGIRKTQWKIWGTSIVISVAGSVIILLVAGN